MAPIASLYSDCRRSFSHLCGFLQVPDCKFSCQVSLINLEDEFGRFRVWAGNLGAHRNGRVSLDHRLRKAPLILKEVIELLKDLKESLQETIATVSCERQPYDELLWPSGSTTYPLEDISTVDLEHEVQVNTTTELREHLLEITHVITCLYRFSVVIRNPVSSDILEKCASIDVSHYESFDIQHTFNKFPEAEEYLIARLGKANSRRRQLFKYYERHHDKVAQYIDIPQSEEEAPATDTGAGAGDTTGDLQDYFPNTSKGPGTIAATVNSQTTIATYVEGPLDLIEVCSEANQSQTSYATSESGDVGKLHVPPPPTPDSTLSGDPFECPYCFSIIAVNGSQSWMKHVFRDLQPYICTFRDCTKPARLFNSRHSWYNHEVESHRREWFCNACQKPYSTKALFEQHLKKNHPDITAGTELPAIADRCERAIESKQVCPLCGGEYPPRQFRSHLARHMEQLALFTLPGMPEETDGNTEPVGKQASVSVSSDRVAEETDDDRELAGTQASIVVSDKEKTKENLTQRLGHTATNIIRDTTEER